jgi:hypothetical protein
MPQQRRARIGRQSGIFELPQQAEIADQARNQPAARMR